MSKKIVRISFIIVNILAAIWLLACVYASYYDSSGQASWINLLCFSLFFALLANVIFILIWLIFTKKQKLLALISFITLVISLPVSRAVIGFNPGGTNFNKDELKSEKRLKVITYNVHMFDLGGWTKDNTTQRKIMDFIKEESPDILCLQEFYIDNKDPKQPFTEIISNLGYPYMEFTQQSIYSKRKITSKAGADEKLSVGMAVFSKYPLTNKKEITLSDRKYYKAMMTDVQVSNAFNLKLLVTHLQSFSLGAEDREFIEKIKDSKDISDQNKRETKSLLRKMSLASHIRAGQANKLNETIAAYKDMPLILCGDFNDIPGSYVYQTLRSNLRDPFEAKGFGLSRTFNAIFPTLRIDHILYEDQHLEAISYEVIRQDLSDHYPVAVEFTLKK